MRRYMLFPLIFLVQAQTCGFPDPPRPEQVSMVRRWAFHQLTKGSLGESPVEPPGLQIGGIVDQSHDFGPLTLIPPGSGPHARGEVFSDTLGRTYWVSTQAANGGPPHPDAIGTVTKLSQYQVFRKDRSDARLTVVVSRTTLRNIDANGELLLKTECPWTIPVTPPEECRPVIRAEVSFDLRAFVVTDGRELLNTGGHARLEGWQSNWRGDAFTNHDATRSFWTGGSFLIDQDVEGTGTGSHASLGLISPIAINIPLGSLGIGEQIELHSIVEALAYTRRQREWYAEAHFRDPVQPTGLAFEFAGLTPVRTPIAEPVPRPPSPAPACSTAPDPAAGILQFDAADYSEPELPGRGATIVVTRSGGSRGAVSASLTTADGTAVSGADYRSLTTNVLFADGEEGSRAVRIPILVDDIAESDKTVNLVLSAPMGCASLGARSSAVLRIMDDDRPIAPPPNFTVGGTVSSLVGTGLVLQEVTAGSELTATNGPFTFDRALADGIPYDVRIGTQPVNPIQVCTVTNGTGTIAAADVTTVVVQCETPSPGGGLDPGFAGGGTATTGLPGGATAMALQADGKIVLAGGRTLTRYNADGTIDSEFGNNGSVTVAFGGAGSDVVQAVAIQPDDLIVVAGFTNATGQNDFVVARYTAVGLPDPSFGTGGVTHTDFHGTTDRAAAVLIQPDGNIILAGHAGTSTPLGIDNDFAVARYTSGGALDATFGTGGLVTTNIAGRTDLGAAAVLLSDGRIVVSGRVADGGGDNPDVGLVRYNTDGTRDGSFGAQGIVRANMTGGWDEASGMALQTDGKIVVSMVAVVGTTFVIAAARFDGNGSPELGFGTGGVASTPLSTNVDVARDVAIQADGKIVVVGQKSTQLLPDIAVVRYLPDGTLDSSFGDAGVLIVDVFADADNATCVAIQPDGKIVVGGFARNGTTTGLALLRIIP